MSNARLYDANGRLISGRVDHLLVPRMSFRDRRPPHARASAKIEGRISFQLINRLGKITRAGESKNLILDQGLDLVADNGLATAVFAYCAVGTGSTAPATSDTSLVSELARTNNTFDSDTYTKTANGVYDISRYFEFAYGSANGNLTEFGMSPDSAGGSNLFSRALFVDGGGSPTTITKTSDEKLRVTYTLTVTLTPVVSTVGSFTITNVTPDPITGHYLLVNPGNAHLPHPDLGLFNFLASGEAPGKSGGYGIYASGPVIGGYSFDGNSNLAYDDGVWAKRFTTAGDGAVTFDYLPTGTPPAYVPGSYQRGSYQQSCDTGAMLYSIAGFAMNGGNWSDSLGNVDNTSGYTFVFDTGMSFTKDDLHTLAVGTPVVSWARA